jgi:hypothetical protein
MRKSLLPTQEGYVRSHWLYGLRYPKSLIYCVLCYHRRAFIRQCVCPADKGNRNCNRYTGVTLAGCSRVRVRGTTIGTTTDAKW